MNIQDLIESIAANHATAKKVGKKHFIEFANELIEAMPKRKSGGGRTASAETVELRENIRQLRGDFTAKQVADKFNVSPVAATQAIKYVMDNGGNIKNAGYGERAGKRGKIPTLYRFS